MLIVPPYIQAGNIAAPVLQFAWDEWQIKQYYWTVDADLFARLDRLTNEANLGLTLAAAEWVFHRFALMNTDPTALQFIEAAWAGMIHPAYCIYTETVDDEWRGPIRGPLAISMAIANDAIFCLRDDPHVATRACWMYNLARHVLLATDQFDLWFGACVARLQRYHANQTEARAAGAAGLFDDPSSFSRPIPRVAYDPRQPYDPSELVMLLNDFLAGLQPASNPFLRDYADLAERTDLVGPPYRYTR